jgi:flagellar basal-body rod protein FlgG
MSGDIYMATAGALAYEKRLEVAANNLANINTAGFKRDEVSFQAYMLSGTGEARPVAPPFSSGGEAASFWIEYSSYTDFTPGPLRLTGNRFDLAIDGGGFFSAQSPDGPVYTRRGNFSLNAEGTLVTQEGWPVLGEGGEIRVDGRGADRTALEFTVGEDGTIRVNGADIGRLQLADFPDPAALVKIGDGYFKPASELTAADALENPRVAQGFLEMSNVEAVRSMTEMIEILRGYESYQRVIRSVDELDAKSINEIGRTA